MTEPAKNDATSTLLMRCVRIAVSVLSMGFIFPHAIAEGFDGNDPAAAPAKPAKIAPIKK